MKCPYQDIGCWHIDDVSHDCEAPSKSDCRHEQDEREYHKAVHDADEEDGE